MSYLILGGTGTVGSEVVRALREKGADFRIVTRSPGKLDDDVEAVEADMTDPTSFAGKFAGSQALFLLNPVSQTELQEGLFALEEAKRAGMDHIVYLSVHNVDRGPHLPHFASKIAMENALKVSGIDYTIVRPSNFQQGDVWLRDAIVDHGVYPNPLGTVGVSRVDVRDIGNAVANAFTDDRHRNVTYTLVGPEALTGPDCARIWGEALGREVAYGGDDLDVWEEQARNALSPWMAYDLRLMFELFQREGLVATPGQLEETRTLLGSEPRSFRAFAEEMASRWT